MKKKSKMKAGPKGLQGNAKALASPAIKRAQASAVTLASANALPSTRDNPVSTEVLTAAAARAKSAMDKAAAAAAGLAKVAAAAKAAAKAAALPAAAARAAKLQR